MTMHLARGLTTINTKKPKKKKLTQKDIERYTVEWRKYNKNMRRNNMHDMQYATVEDYIAYCRGEVKFKPNTKRERYIPPVTREDPTRNIPSMMEKMIADGTWAKQSGGTPKKESLKYTGTLIKGIATMHKSNAVPIINQQQAKDIANMRRS